MSEGILRPGHVASAALVIGGVLVFLMPERSLSIAQLVVMTAAAATGLWALAVNAPFAWWTSPFDAKGAPAGERYGSEEVETIRATLSGRRQPLAGAPPLPGEAMRLLEPLIRVALERKGLDPRSEEDLNSVRDLLSPVSWAILTSEPLTWPRWHKTRRPDEGQVAEAVHQVLDDLEWLSPSDVQARDSNPQPPPT